ncbi:heme oxygenase [Fusarium longipes]|uniref:Heme oxygenase n=1 Tax=Fusarium longipes TaxID=694270 RepID=A0A395S7F4_9HYPO|nr:heme oxygenase [Fusarium longipes]
MPRPADTYTHDQFRPVDSANLGETVECFHCKRWQGSAKVLSRKKAHLQNCPEYAAWRAAGNGQELAPSNPYNATGRRAFAEAYGFDNSSLHLGPDQVPTMQRIRSTLDMSKYFDEFFDDSLDHKADHLMQCKDFLATAEGEELLASGSLVHNVQQHQPLAIWNGARPHPDLMVRHVSNRPHSGTASIGTHSRPSSSRTPQRLEASSLAQHLLDQSEDLLTNATQHGFLAHAGSGSLSENALNQWLAQIGYISRSLVPFTGSLIGKIRIPETANLEHDSTFRCLDLLCSAVSNMKKELEFLEATKREYGLEVGSEEPRPPTKSFIDLFNSASCASATLLEGMVLLWAVEILFYHSFSYAGSFVARSMPTPERSSFSLPSYSLPSSASPSTYSGQAARKDRHTNALREALIENWKSENFGRFVDVCRSIVDELAMVQMTGNGRAERSACERVFNQAVWLWAQVFPQTTVTEEQGRFGQEDSIRGGRENNAMNRNRSTDDSFEIEDEDNAQTSTHLGMSMRRLGLAGYCNGQGKLLT